MTTVEEVEAARSRPDTLLWVDVEDASTDLLGALARCLGLHPLISEDIVERNQRAKIERTNELVHLVVFALAQDGEQLTSSEVDIVLGDRFLLTSHDDDWRPLRSPKRRDRVDEFLAGGVDFLLWAILDEIVDGYFPVFDRLDDAIDELQAEVIAEPDTRVLGRLLRLRRDLVEIRHAVLPEREILNQLSTGTVRLVRQERVVYFRDVYDHLIRLSDIADSHRELLSGTLDAYLSTVNNNLSDVMKRLTAVTVILAGIGAVGGLFGMSEAGSAFARGAAPGFWIVTFGSLVAAALALLWFRRIGWL